MFKYLSTKLSPLFPIIVVFLLTLFALTHEVQASIIVEQPIRDTQELQTSAVLGSHSWWLVQPLGNTLSGNFGSITVKLKRNADTTGRNSWAWIIYRGTTSVLGDATGYCSSNFSASGVLPIIGVSDDITIDGVDCFIFDTSHYYWFGISPGDPNNHVEDMSVYGSSDDVWSAGNALWAYDAGGGFDNTHSTNAIVDMGFFVDTGDSPVIPPESTNTRFVSISPGYGSTTASTNVNVAARVYNNEPFDIPLQYNQVCADFQSLEAATREFLDPFTSRVCFDLSVSGYQDFSTTTALAQGLTSVIWSFYDPENQISYGPGYSTSTQFIVVSSQFQATETGYSTTTTSSQPSFCVETSSQTLVEKILCFIPNAISNLLRTLFVPSSPILSNVVSLNDSFFQRAPFAYPYLIYKAFATYDTVATSSLVAYNLTVIFPTTTPFMGSSTSGIAGHSLTFVDWSALSAAVATSSLTRSLASFSLILNILFGLGFVFWLISFIRKHMHP